MAGRVQQDAFIDDSDESCPLCVEEFDLSDKNFRPCPCGYQVCQFCYNNIKNHMNGLCPACRRPYDDQSIEWKIVSPEEQKADIALQARKKALARKKESEQRQVETLNRKNLAGIRVVQKNLVYVVGLSQKSSEEEFLRTLRGPQYFGQYGKITKIVVSKAKEGHTNANNNNSIGVYVTFENREDAAKCIAAVDGSPNAERTLRAQYGTTKYCSAFLRNETCGNRNCTFLHETGEDNDSFSRADLSSMNALSTQRPAQQASSSRPNQQPSQPQPPPQQAPQSTFAAPQAITRDEAMSRSDSGDGSALPSSASWAAKNAQNAQNESKLSSKTASLAASSPVTTNSSVPVQPVEARQIASEPPPPPPERTSTPEPQFVTVRPAPRRPVHALEPAMKTLMNSSFKFIFDRSMYNEEDLKEIDAYPPLFDDRGGLVRYRMAKEQERERQKQEEERNVIGAMSATEEEEAPASGSLQLGGEPETQDEPNDNSGRISAQQRSAIKPPFGSSSSFPFGGSNFPANNAANLGRTLTPQQQHQLSLLRSQIRNQQSPVNNGQFQSGYTGNTSLHHHQQSNPFQMQNQAFNTAQGHGRQASRYTFANDSASASTAVKPASNPQLMAQQAAMMPGNQNKHYQNQPIQSNVHSNHFYSGVQGPPPGLKSSGTPPISGGGMFGQGHGFASAMGGSTSFGGNVGGKSTNDDLMRELLRTRNGSLNGQGPDIGKREFKLPFTQQPMTSDAPASSLLSSLYGAQIGGHNGYQDHHLQKQKKKGKKHRHANTSSSGGGGTVDLADPSILQARMHHGAAGQGQFGAQGQDLLNFPSQHDSIQPIDRPVKISSSNPPIVASSSTKPVSKITSTPTTLQQGLSLRQDFPPLVSRQSMLPSAPPPPPLTSQQSMLPPTPQDFPPLVSRQSTLPNAPPHSQTKVTASTPIKPVVPVVPNPSSKPINMQKEPQLSEKVDDTEPSTPLVPEASMKIKPKENEASSLTEILTASKAAGSSPGKVTKLMDKKERPSKLDIAAAKDAKTKDKDSTGTAAVISGPAPSQPSTPATASSQVSASSTTRPNQVRASRVPPPPKVETRPASPAIAPATMSKQPSRRPSITSIDRPGTPASEKFWDNMSFASTTLSRANSPPLSKVGSAPVRQTTKSQQKKERQARAKQAEEASKAEELPTKVEEPMQAPVIGRKKKAKKERTQEKTQSTTGTADSTPTVTRPTSPVPKQEEPVEEKAEPVTPVREGRKAASKMATDTKEPDTLSSPATPASNDQQKGPLTAASIFASLVKPGELSPTRVSELFKPVQGLNCRFEGLEQDLAVADETRVSDSQLHSLDQGEAITIQRSPTNHVVVLPDRSALQGLNAAQSARYLELRKQALANGDVPSSQALANLVAVLPKVNLPVARVTSGTPSEDHKLPNHFATPTPGPAPLGNMPKYAAIQAIGDGKLPKMTPGLTVDSAEFSLAQRRKEAEVLEKKTNAMIKKNRRLLFGNVH